MTRRQRAAPAAATGGIGKAPHRLYVRDFSDDVRLEIIPISSGYEGWQMMNPFGTEFFARGGGQISLGKAEANA